MNHIVALLMGVVLLAGSVWIRRGSARARFWIPKQKKDISRSGILIMDERWVLVFLPALGLFFLTIGASLPANAAPHPWNYLLLTICLLGAAIGLVGIIWGVTNLYYPERLRPVWLQAYYRQLGFSPSRGTRLAPAWYREHLGGGNLENPHLNHKHQIAEKSGEKISPTTSQNKRSHQKRRPH
ncbi:hypothetical protein [Varibaculum vaginae]|uniref:hypothetical protein n=1 Tax=Varibaculum vaginae TaxID=2364797 RepID=UPI000F090F1F|nr:hypothetical protein [Varibaculum vaginae]